MTDALFSMVQLNGQTISLRLAGGRIASIDPVDGPARAVMLPLLIDPHVHLDKTYTSYRCAATNNSLLSAMKEMRRDMLQWTEADLRLRAGRGLQDAWSYGVAAMRTHIDWTEPGVPLAWGLMAELAEDWRGRITLQRASLSPLDLLGDPDQGPAIARKVAQTGGVLGAFVYRNNDLEAKLNLVFALAARNDLLLDFHVDEGTEPEANGFDTVVALTLRYGLGGRVLCGHACALAVRPTDEVNRVMDAAAHAGVALTVLPTTNSYLQDSAPGRTPRLRGIAPIHELRAAGVSVLLGADNVCDPFYPYGRYDPLHILRQATFAAHMTPGDWVDAITTAPAVAMGLAASQLAAGEPADFILIEGANWQDVINDPSAVRHVFRAGRANQKALA